MNNAPAFWHDDDGMVRWHAPFPHTGTIPRLSVLNSVYNRERSRAARFDPAAPPVFGAHGDYLTHEEAAKPAQIDQSAHSVADRTYPDRIPSTDSSQTSNAEEHTYTAMTTRPSAEELADCYETHLRPRRCKLCGRSYGRSGETWAVSFMMGVIATLAFVVTVEGWWGR